MAKNPTDRAPFWLRWANKGLSAINSRLDKALERRNHEIWPPRCQICGKKLVFVRNKGSEAGIWGHEDNTDHAPLVRLADLD